MSAAEPRVVERPPQPSAAVRVQQSIAELDLGALFGGYLPALAARLADLGVEPAGAPYGRYHEFGPERADVEIGIPVSKPVAGLRPLGQSAHGDIGASELPGGTVASLIHLGPYDSLGESQDAVRAWIADQGHVAAGGPWETYLDDPGNVDDVARLRTEICWPLLARGDGGRR